MQENSKTANRLFLICPTSQLETLISERFGRNTYFLTALGAVFDFERIAYAEAFADFLIYWEIREIYLVHDTSCLFIRNILDRKPSFGTQVEKVILELLIDHYARIMQQPSRKEQEACLSRLTIEQQALNLLSNTLLQQTISAQGICLKGLMTCKTVGQLKELNLKPSKICK